MSAAGENFQVLVFPYAWFALENERRRRKKSGFSIFLSRFSTTFKCDFHKFQNGFPQLSNVISTIYNFPRFPFWSTKSFHNFHFVFHDLQNPKISVKFSTTLQKCAFHNFFHDFKGGGVTLCYLYGSSFSCSFDLAWGEGHIIPYTVYCPVLQSPHAAQWESPFWAAGAAGIPENYWHNQFTLEKRWCQWGSLVSSAFAI